MDSITNINLYGIDGKEMEKTENPEIPTLNARTKVKSEK